MRRSTPTACRAHRLADTCRGPLEGQLSAASSDSRARTLHAGDGSRVRFEPLHIGGARDTDWEVSRLVRRVVNVIGMLMMAVKIVVTVMIVMSVIIVMIGMFMVLVVMLIIVTLMMIMIIKRI